MREAEDHDLVITDSLRAACPSLDENSSEVRRVLDVFTRVSERTGAVFGVVSHARKPSANDKGGSQMAIRGSGAIFDACGSVLVLEASKGDAPRVEHVKARISGQLAPVHELHINDEPDGGLRVELVQGVDAHDGAAAVRAAKLSEVEQAIRTVVEDHPGIGTNKLKALVGGGKDFFMAALGELVDTGAIVVREGARCAKLHYSARAQHDD